MNQQTNDIVINARINANQAVKDLQRLRKAAAGGSAKAMYALAEGQQRVYKAQERLNRSLGKVPFSGYALSIMFFGAAMVNVFKQVTTFGVRAFQDVMHSVDGTVTQFDLLNASLFYLGFTIGQALEPVIAWIIPIIESIATWVSENQRLAAGILLTVGALGFLVGTGGFLKLAFDGFAQLGVQLGLFTTSADGAFVATEALKTGLRNLAGVGAIVLGLKLTYDAIEGLNDGRLGDALFDGISSALMLAGGLKLLKGAKGGGWLIVLGLVVQEAEKGSLFKSVFTVIGPLIAGLYAAIEGIRLRAVNMWRAIRGQDETAVPSFKELYNEGLRSIKQVASLWDGAITSTKDTLNNGFKVDVPTQMSSQAPPGYGLSSQMTPASMMPASFIFNGPVTIQSDNAEKLYSEIRSYSG